MDVERLRQVADLFQPRRGEGVGRPRRRLVEVEMRHHLRLDPGVPGELGADRLGGELVADEQTALGRGCAEGDRPCHEPGEEEEQRQHHTKEDGLASAQLAGDDQPPGEPCRQGAEHRELDELGGLVERRLAQQRLVAVIEARELRAHDQYGDAGKGRERQVQRPAGDCNGKKKCGHESSHVTDNEQPAKNRVAPHGGGWATYAGSARGCNQVRPVSARPCAISGVRVQPPPDALLSPSPSLDAHDPLASLLDRAAPPRAAAPTLWYYRSGALPQVPTRGRS